LSAGYLADLVPAAFSHNSIRFFIWDAAQKGFRHISSIKTQWETSIDRRTEDTIFWYIEYPELGKASCYPAFLHALQTEMPIDRLEIQQALSMIRLYLYTRTMSSFLFESSPTARTSFERVNEILAIPEICQKLLSDVEPQLQPTLQLLVVKALRDNDPGLIDTTAPSVRWHDDQGRRTVGKRKCLQLP
jgi:hypothetical protein